MLAAGYYHVLYMVLVNTVQSKVVYDMTLHTEPRTWDDALAICTSQGQDLASLTDRDVFDAAVYYFTEGIWANTAKKVWIGLHKPATTQTTNMVWTSSCDSGSTFANWAVGHENPIPLRNCISININNNNEIELYRESCLTENFYLCQSANSSACKFVTVPGYKYNNADTNYRTQVINSVTREQCRSECLLDSDALGNPCMSFNYNIGNPKCGLWASDDMFNPDRGKTAKSTHELHILRCGIYPDTDTAYYASITCDSIFLICLGRKHCFPSDEASSSTNMISSVVAEEFTDTIVSSYGVDSTSTVTTTMTESISINQYPISSEITVDTTASLMKAAGSTLVESSTTALTVSSTVTSNAMTTVSDASSSNTEDLSLAVMPGSTVDMSGSAMDTSLTVLSSSTTSLPNNYAISTITQYLGLSTLTDVLTSSASNMEQISSSSTMPGSSSIIATDNGTVTDAGPRCWCTCVNTTLSEEDVIAILKSLRIDKNETALARRSLISASDNRTSSVVIGSIGTTIVVGTIVFMTCLDLNTLYEAVINKFT